MRPRVPEHEHKLELNNDPSVRLLERMSSHGDAHADSNDRTGNRTPYGHCSTHGEGNRGPDAERVQQPHRARL